MIPLPRSRLLAVAFVLLCADCVFGGSEKPATPATDLHGDPLPPGAIARCGTLRFRHGSGASKVLFSPDGTLIASCGRDEAIHIWDTATGKLCRRLVCASVPQAFVFVPGSTTLISGHDDYIIRFWDAKTGKALRKLVGHESGIVSLAISPDGRILASGGYGAQVWTWPPQPIEEQPARPPVAKLRLWDAATGKLLHELPGHETGVAALCFAADGTRLVSANPSTSLRVWDSANGKLLHQIEVSKENRIRDLRELAIGTIGVLTEKGSAWGQLFACPLHEVVARDAFGKIEPRAFVVSRDRSILFAASENGITLHEAGTGKEIRRIDVKSSWARSLACSPDGKLLAVCNGGPSIRLWDIAAGKLLFDNTGHAEPVVLARFLPDNKTVLSVSKDGQCRLWEAATGKPLRSFRLGDDGYARPSYVDLSPDGQTLAVANREPEFWEIGSGVKKADAKQQFFFGGMVRFTPDGKMLAITRPPVVITNRQPGESTAHIVEVPSGKIIADLGKHEGRASPPVFSHDGKFLAVSPGKLQLWDVAAKSMLPARFDSYFAPFAFCRNDRFIIGGSASNFGSIVTNELAILDKQSGKQTHQFDLKTYDRSEWETSDGIIWTSNYDSGRSLLALSPNGITLAATVTSRDNRIQLRMVPAGTKLGILSGHQGDVQTAAFSPNGKYLVTAAADSTLLIWDVDRQVHQHFTRKVMLPAEKLAHCWQDLGSTNEAAAAKARDRLVDAHQQAVPLLRGKLRPVSDAGVERWIAELDSAVFEERQTAMLALQRREFAVEPALRNLLAGAPSLEHRRRAEQLLQNLEQPMTQPEVLREWRSVIVLEQIGTADARQLLESLAKGSAHARFTQNARAALQRFSDWPQLADPQSGP